MVKTDFYDLKRLFRFREALHRLDPAGPPRAEVVEGTMAHGLGRCGILSGSFNPPTLAHVELASRARQSFQLDHVIFSISRVTVDKESLEGLSLEDRLLLMAEIAGELGWASVAAVNRGLYFEQSRAFRSLVGNKTRLYFLVGLDKVMQIFDPRYYQDRDAALKDLFIEAQLIVADRGPLGREDLERLLARRENESYQDRVYSLPLPEGVRGISSSTIRGGIAGAAPVTSQLPAVVANFFSEVGASRPGYESRSRLLDRLYSVREWAEERVDLKALYEITTVSSQKEKALNDLLVRDDLSPEQIREGISAIL